MDQSVNAIAKQISGLDAQIAAETQRMAANTQAKHDETQRKLSAARNAVEEAKSALDTTTTQMRELQDKADTTRKEGETAQEQLQGIKAKVQNCQGLIQRAKDAQKNSLIPYGNNIKTVLDAIKTMRWNGDPPHGPLGLNVKAKDPQIWGELLRSQLSQYLTAFAITDHRDRNELKKLLEKTNK